MYEQLFAYGTLMCDAIMAEISGFHLPHVSATLRGYRRIRVKGQHYPALFPNAEGCVEGILYLNVPEPAWARLDRFEGEMYSREIVQVARNDGLIVSAVTYVARDEFRDALIELEWDFGDFLRKNKESFCRSYRGQMERK